MSRAIHSEPRSCAAGCWTPGRASPARFREDANAEEDYTLGGYRDRGVVELAQNAADAAAGAGVSSPPSDTNTGAISPKRPALEHAQGGRLPRPPRLPAAQPPP